MLASYLTKVAIPLFVITSSFIIKTISDAGEFKTIEPHFSGDCISVDGVVGAEDITFLKDGTALISSDDRRNRISGSDVQGTIYRYRPNESSNKLLNLMPKLDIGFHPHGISAYEHKDGKTYLAVVNHHSSGLFSSFGGHSVEIFIYNGDSLSHIKSISHPLMISPNDIVLINKDQFYVTNDHGSSSKREQTLEEYLQLKRCNALFYDGNDFRVAASGLGFANGININNDGSILYIAETLGKRLSIFSRDIKTNSLDFIDAIDFNSGVDNIEIDSDGNLWIGSHPKVITFSRHMKDSTILSPSQVYKLSFDKENNHRIEEFYLNLGEELSGSTVAAVYDSTILIGSVFERYFLDCSY